MLRSVPRRSTFAAVALVPGLLLAACGPDDGRELADPDPDLTAVPVATTVPAAIDETEPELFTLGPGRLRLEGVDFSPGSSLPVASSCEGPTSPALRWTAPPRRSRELALVAQDVDGNGAIQWLVTGIPPETREVAAGEVPAGGDTRANSTGTETWTSPCAQDGIMHRIVFSLYVLNRPLPQGAGDPASIVQAVRDTAIGAATVIGRSGIAGP
jgi:phosphatidylethanolamine-binding protein (PEBP) family uncharacterized protein